MSLAVSTLRPALLTLLAAPPRSRSPQLKVGAAWVEAVGSGVHGAEAGAAYYDLFSSLATDEDFAHNVFAQKPVLMDAVAGVAGSFDLEQLKAAVDSDFLDAGRGIPDGAGGWKMAPVSQPRGPSFEDAKMRYVDVEEALKQGTVVFNSAGAHIPILGTMCLAAMDAFQLPNCLNLYVTAKGTATSAPPHTDKQDVFVLQSCGAKRWRVYEPPPPASKPHADPLARGKAHDALSLSEMADPLIDCVLAPGHVLYIPAGFPHTTDTVNTEAAGESAASDSVHLTIGIDTHIWGLNYASLRAGALARAKLPDALNVQTLPREAYWKLMEVPSSIGFLAQHVSNCGGASGASGASDASDASDASGTQAADVSSRLVQLTRLAEPKRWEESTSDGEMAAALEAEAVAEQCGRHASRVFDVQRVSRLHGLISTDLQDALTPHRPAPGLASPPFPPTLPRTFRSPPLAGHVPRRCARPPSSQPTGLAARLSFPSQ